MNHSIILCGIVRNAENGLIRNIPIINMFLACCKDYNVFIYENDSTDRTKKILTGWHLSEPERIHISLNDIDPNRVIPSPSETPKINPFFSRKRIEKMAALRNKYMEYIDEQGWFADYLMVVDLDVAQLSLDSMLSSFESGVEWDAVTAFGYSTSPKLRRRYHDSYALILLEEQNCPQTEEMIRKNAEILGRMRPDEEWMRVASGFGGLAIYRFDAVKGLRYQVIDNHDSRVEVRCEHYSIYEQMRARGYDRFFINPAMQLKYQDLTFSIIWKSLIRRIVSFCHRQ